MSWLRLMEENIRESEHLGEDSAEVSGTETRKGQVSPLHKGSKQRVAKLIKDMWPAYLIEVLVIILGISITLALEEWRAGSRERKLETIYQKNLLADIEADLQSLQYVMKSTQQLLDRGNELVAFMDSPSTRPITPAQVESDLSIILGRPNFISNDATFSDLKSSGNLPLLRDIPLKNLLFAYYSQTQTIKEVQAAEQQAAIVISGPYFMKRFPMGGHEKQPSALKERDLQEAMTSFEFANNVQLRIANRKELLYTYQRADTLAIQIRNLLSPD